MNFAPKSPLARGEGDFERLSTDIARVLNEVALTTDRRNAAAVSKILSTLKAVSSHKEPRWST